MFCGVFIFFKLHSKKRNFTNYVEDIEEIARGLLITPSFPWSPLGPVSSILLRVRPLYFRHIHISRTHCCVIVFYGAGVQNKAKHKLLPQSPWNRTTQHLPASNAGKPVQQSSLYLCSKVLGLSLPSGPHGRAGEGECYFSFAPG